MKRGLFELLDIRRGDSLAVVGCGGKTTLIETLSRVKPDWRVLISPTTRILRPAAPALVCATADECARHHAQLGPQYMGIFLPQSGKLGALPTTLLRRLASDYDLVLLEADGSRGLPVKGWREDERPVPDFCQKTIGVLPVWLSGRLLTEETVFQLPLLLRLIGQSEGETLTTDGILRLITAENGLFRHAVGETLLFLNQAENETERVAAQMLAERLLRYNPQTGEHKPGRVLWGSARAGTGEEANWR